MSYLAQSCCTNSKHPRNWCAGTPLEYDKSLVDWSSGLGANLIGWDNSYSLHAPGTHELAKKLCQKFHFDKAKILQSGSDACAGACRIARAYTGKQIVLFSGYHGTHDTFICCEQPGAGTIGHGLSYKFPDPAAINVYLKTNLGDHNIAAVIVEPLQLDTAWKPHILELRKLTRKLGIILIHDEIITGMRVPHGSVSSWWKIKPDLLVMGKGLGNGYPISVILGKNKLMDNPDYFLSNTHNANESAVRAALKTLKKMSPQAINEMWRLGKYFMAEANAWLQSTGVKLAGYPTRMEWQGDVTVMSRIWELMLSRGHLCGRPLFINRYHTYRLMRKFLDDLEWAVEGCHSKPKRVVQFSFKRNN